MKFFKRNHYRVKTDVELLAHLFNQLEDSGIESLAELRERLAELEITSFADLLTYTSGPDCDEEVALTMEEIIDRLRISEQKRDEILTSSNEVGRYLANKMFGLKQEEFWAFYFDNGNRIIAEKRISVGTLDRSMAHPRDIFRWAVVFNSSAIIVAHNHPSGRLTPSSGDIRMTENLKQAAKLMKIDLLDHFVIGKGQYLSMRETEMF
ncbi:MAG: DNA repair protein RadC [Lactobacillus sp.]|nr:DNA repair protein RadC [Lactobacillus sp.]